MKKHFSFLVVVVLFTSSTIAQELKWFSVPEAINLNKTAPRKIIIDVYTDWCGWCKVMDRETFNNPVIARILKENYYPVKFNAETKDSIFYNGKMYRTSGPSAKAGHELAIYLLQGKLSYPSLVFMDENGQVITAMSGFRKPAEMEPLLKYLATAQKPSNEDYQKFLATFKSELPAEQK
jgi:thioredoxin-related protein